MGCGTSIPAGDSVQKESKPAPACAAVGADDQEQKEDQNNSAFKQKSPASPHALNRRTATCDRIPQGGGSNEVVTHRMAAGGVDGMNSRSPELTDTRAMPEHIYLIFDLWPCVRPGVPEFLKLLSDKKKAGEIQRIYIYTANTSLHWVRFIMQCIMKYYGVPLDTFDGIKHAPGGLKVVPEGAVLYDDHPENAVGNCIPVMPYTNEIPWEILAPILEKLPDHTEASCPLWEECGGLQSFIDRDKQYTDPPHDKESEETLFDLIRDFKPYSEVLLDLDETLIAGARLSAYYNALNHFLMFREQDNISTSSGTSS